MAWCTNGRAADRGCSTGGLLDLDCLRDKHSLQASMKSGPAIRIRTAFSPVARRTLDRSRQAALLDGSSNNRPLRSDVPATSGPCEAV